MTEYCNCGIEPPHSKSEHASLVKFDPRPRFVVPDALVAAFREAFGDAAEIIPVSQTRLDECPL